MAPRRVEETALRILRGIGALLALACAAAIVAAWVHAPGLPDGPATLARVDAAVLEHLRANPGLHVPLAEGYTLAVPLELRDDRANRFLFGTDLDVREPVPRLSIHIQRKDGRAAIHADRFNPLAGVRGWVLHNTLDTPALALFAGLGLGVALLLRGKEARGRGA